VKFPCCWSRQDRPRPFRLRFEALGNTVRGRNYPLSPADDESNNSHVLSPSPAMAAAYEAAPTSTEVGVSAGEGVADAMSAMLL
jgi:hypothetical protein